MAVDTQRSPPALETDDARLAHFADARPDLGAKPELGATLREIFDDAREAWPDVELADGPFIRFLAEKLPGGAPAERSLAALRTGDLYLTCACARGDARALARLEQVCSPVVDWAVARLGASPEQSKDVGQQVRQHLLTPRSAADGSPLPPRIADFSGKGALSAWVRVVAMREAVDVLQRFRRERPAEDDELIRRLEPDAGPELAYIRRLYRDEFKAAFAEAIGALSKRERTLLRQHALDGLSIDKLATFYGIHRSTAARRLEAVRRAALEHTRQALSQRLQLKPDEFESVMRLIQSQLDVTLAPLLRAHAEPAEGAPCPPPRGKGKP